MTTAGGPTPIPAAGAARRCWSPFVLRHAPMRRLMLVNIADEPRCPGIEPQVVAADGMKIDVRVREHRRRAMRPVSLLAPIGGDADRPLALPLFCAHGFTLVPRRGTDVEIRVDGAERSPARSGWTRTAPRG